MNRQHVQSDGAYVSLKNFGNLKIYKLYNFTFKYAVA